MTRVENTATKCDKIHKYCVEFESSSFFLTNHRNPRHVKKRERTIIRTLAISSPPIVWINCCIQRGTRETSGTAATR